MNIYKDWCEYCSAESPVAMNIEELTKYRADIDKAIITACQKEILSAVKAVFKEYPSIEKIILNKYGLYAIFDKDNKDYISDSSLSEYEINKVFPGSNGSVVFSRKYHENC